MNAADRKEVSSLVSSLEDLQQQVAEIGERLRTMADDEQEKFDNLTEGLQASEQGQSFEMAAEALSEAADACENGEITEALDALGQIEN